MHIKCHGAGDFAISLKVSVMRIDAGCPSSVLHSIFSPPLKPGLIGKVGPEMVKDSSPLLVLFYLGYLLHITETAVLSVGVG